MTLGLMIFHQLLSAVQSLDSEKDFLRSQEIAIGEASIQVRNDLRQFLRHGTIPSSTASMILPYCIVLRAIHGRRSMGVLRMVYCRDAVYGVFKYMAAILYYDRCIIALQARALDDIVYYVR